MMFDRERVEQIKESVRQFMQDSEEYPTTAEMQGFLDIKSDEALVAIYELVTKNEIIHDPEGDVWLLLTVLRDGVVSITNQKVIENE